MTGSDWLMLGSLVAVVGGLVVAAWCWGWTARDRAGCLHSAHGHGPARLTPEPRRVSAHRRPYDQDLAIASIPAYRSSAATDEAGVLGVTRRPGEEATGHSASVAPTDDPYASKSIRGDAGERTSLGATE